MGPSVQFKVVGAKKNLENVAHHGLATKKILAFQML